MSKNEPAKTERPRPITEEEYLANLHSTVDRLEDELARRNVEIHKIEDVNNCESCHTPVKGPKGGSCPACLGPTKKPPKSEQ